MMNISSIVMHEGPELQQESVEDTTEILMDDGMGPIDAPQKINKGNAAQLFPNGVPKDLESILNEGELELGQ